MQLHTRLLGSVSLAATLSLGASFPAQAVFFHTSSGSIDGSLCVGNDCVSSESFGSDTIRMKENNLRLHYNDTSTSASFPSNDWRIEINASANGGSNHYAIQDATNGRNIALFEAGAPSNSLRVDSGGRLGITEDNPVVELHITDGDSPTLRLEQDGASGFTPQAWDMAGNEANFFIRDVSNGSTLPFRIEPGAGTNALYIEDTDDVGVGTNTPTASLHVRRTDSTGKLLVEDTGTAFNVQLELIKAGTPRIRFDDSTADVAPGSGTDLAAEWDIGLNGGRDFIFRNVETNANVFTFEKTGDMTIAGALTENSDKNAKMAIVPVDTDEILSKVESLPIATWSYKDNAGVRHIGPMAQDFYALFGTGVGETGISTLDTSGVALAAIKALSEDNKVLSAENAAQRDLIAQLASRLDALEQAAQ